jgi:uncharacterized membrane protein
MPLCLVVVAHNVWLIEMIYGWVDMMGIMYGVDRYIDR